MNRVELFVGSEWDENQVGFTSDGSVYLVDGNGIQLEEIARISGQEILVDGYVVGAVGDDGRTIEKRSIFKSEPVGDVDELGVVFHKGIWGNERFGRVQPATPVAGAALLMLFKTDDSPGAGASAVLAGAATGAAIKAAKNRGDGAAAKPKSEGSDQLAKVVLAALVALGAIFVAAFRKWPRATFGVAMAAVACVLIFAAVDNRNEESTVSESQSTSRSGTESAGDEPVISGDALGARLTDSVGSQSSDEVTSFSCPDRDLYAGESVSCTVHYSSGSKQLISVDVSGTHQEPRVELGEMTEME